MAIYPKIQAFDAGQEVIDVFRGLNRAEKIAEGEWSDEVNLTSDRYPMLSVRGKRSTAANLPDLRIQAILAKDDLYVLATTARNDGDVERTAVLLKGSEAEEGKVIERMDIAQAFCCTA